MRASQCDSEVLDHSVLLVGFGKDTQGGNGGVDPYFLLQNSWGAGWGEGGYFRVEYGQDTCGVAL